MNGDVRVTGKLLFEVCNEITVKLNQVKLGATGQQRACECRLARANLYNQVAGLGCNAGDNPFDDMPVMQEVLAETLSCLVSQRHISAATRAALYMLLASA